MVSEIQWLETRIEYVKSKIRRGSVELQILKKIRKRLENE
tara:strand:- start:562 stop:681 length:120 start_codon:yes stop_codon:yes gene_type:complete